MPHPSPAQPDSGPTICIAEDRSSCEPPLRILVASLARHSPSLPVILFCPNATPAFVRWLASYPQCRLNPAALDGPWSKYDIKPLALATALRLTDGAVAWVDSDMLIARDVRSCFAGLSPETLVVAEEALMDGHGDPDGMRARLWGMPVGRVLPFSLNSCVLRVTKHHLPLLDAWHDLLQGEAYRAAQARPWYERPPHMAGDQEVLTALLASERFATIPLAFLRRGRDIIQFFGRFGYTTAERLRHLTMGMPPFVHSQGFRPWWPEPAPTSGTGARFTYLYHALSPYTVLARDYADVLEDTRWLAPPTKAAHLLTTRNAALTGLPLAVAADVVRRLRGTRKRASD